MVRLRQKKSLYHQAPVVQKLYSDQKRYPLIGD